MADLNPLSGRPLESWQRLVTGPAETGYRKTVVDMRAGAALEPWIERLDLPIGNGATVTVFVDTGTFGGSFDQDDVQQLPDLVTTERRSTSLGELLLVALLVVVGGSALKRAVGGRSWV